VRLAVPAQRLPAWRAVYGYFARWRDDGILARLHDGLRD
jgi:transposase